MGSTDVFDRLMTVLGRLPGVGRRSAERMAIKLVRDPNGLCRDLASALDEAGKTLCACSRCGSVTAVSANPCRLCTGTGRDAQLLCVVEEATDVALIEKSGSFRGRYHTLGGKLSPGRGLGAEDLRVRSLLDRIDREKFQEVILALSTDVEGDTTAGFLAELLKGRKVKVTRLAFGLPAGSGIVYSDPVTLARAFRGRTQES